MLSGSETWPLKKKNVMTLQWAEMRMTRWMYGVKVTERFTCKELIERLERDYIITVKGARPTRRSIKTLDRGCTKRPLEQGGCYGLP